MPPIPPIPPLKPQTPPQPPRELEGDSYIHQHHPANSPSSVGDMEKDREGFKEATPVTTPLRSAGFQGDGFGGSAMGSAAGRDGKDEREKLESPILRKER